MPILTAQERVGTLLADKIRLERILGEGGMGVVYAGTHLGLEIPVAVKFLHGELARHPEVVSRFLNEARATSRLRHPNVIDVRDVGLDTDGSAYMVLELLRGESLATQLETRGALTLRDAVSCLAPVMDALEAAHAIGIIHRDIKPDNVFLSREPDGRIVPKVLDFGIAKLADSTSGSATATGAVMGTPYYMAPEQALGRKHQIGPCSDVWSMAVMTYECLTGRLPFVLGEESSMAAILLALMTAEIVPLSRYRADLPPALEDLLSAALVREPSRRIQSMRELQRAFVAIGDAAGDGAALVPHHVLGAATGPLIGALSSREQHATAPTMAGAVVAMSTAIPTVAPSIEVTFADTPAVPVARETGAGSVGSEDTRHERAATQRTGRIGRVLAWGAAAAVALAVGGVVASQLLAPTPTAPPLVVAPEQPPPQAPQAPPTSPAPVRISVSTSSGDPVGATEPSAGTPPPAPPVEQAREERPAAGADALVPPREPRRARRGSPPDEPTPALARPAEPSPNPASGGGPTHRGGSVSLDDF